MDALLLHTMPVPSDITVESPLGRTVLVIECKFAKEASPSAAARLRNRLLVDGYLNVPSEAFFMLALPKSFYLWKPGVASDAVPDCSTDPTPVLRSYLGRIAEQNPWPGAENMELAVSAWLSDLATAIRKPDASEADQMLVDAGVFDLMKGGSVRHDRAP